MTEHLSAALKQIQEHFGKSEPEPHEQMKNPLDPTEFGHVFVAALCEVADYGTNIDTGTDGQSYDCHITRQGIEYRVNIKPSWDTKADEPIG